MNDGRQYVLNLHILKIFLWSDFT